MDMPCTCPPFLVTTGVPLTLGNDTSLTRSLITSPLTMSLSDVTSARAKNLTADLWSASTGAPWDNLPETPPDGG